MGRKQEKAQQRKTYQDSFKASNTVTADAQSVRRTRQLWQVVLGKVYRQDTAPITGMVI